MAKLKSKFFNAIQNPLAGRGHTRASLTALSTAFYTKGDTIVMRSKPKSPPHTSESQLAQQERWKDGDCMWRHMTIGQRILWGNFFYVEQRAGRTIKTETTKKTTATQQIPPKDMGQLAYFMSHALRLDLLDYLQDFLLSEWVVVSVTDAGDNWEVTVGLTNPYELTIATIFQERLPIRGR